MDPCLLPRGRGLPVLCSQYKTSQTISYLEKIGIPFSVNGKSKLFDSEIGFRVDAKIEGKTMIISPVWVENGKDITESVSDTIIIPGVQSYILFPRIERLYRIEKTIPMGIISSICKNPILRIPLSNKTAWKELESQLVLYAKSMPDLKEIGIDGIEHQSILIEVASDESRNQSINFYCNVYLNKIPLHEIEKNNSISSFLKSVFSKEQEGKYNFRNEDAVRFWGSTLKILKDRFGEMLNLVFAKDMNEVRVISGKPSISIKLVNGLLDSEISFNEDELCEYLPEIKSLLLGGKKWTCLKDGQILQLENRSAEILSELGENGIVSSDGKCIKITNNMSQLTSILQTIEEEPCILNNENVPTINIEREIYGIRDRMLSARIEDSVIPEELTAELRSYQKEGLSWIQYLMKIGVGGILADDMGLGKTVTSIGAILSSNHSGPSLVIAPASVIYNWQREIEKFTKNTKTFVFHGNNRPKEIDISNDFIITTYATALRDIDLLRTVNWNCLVLDEAQNIKTPSSKISKALKCFPAAFRLALSGTPIENRALELWSIIDTVNPGIFGKEKTFKKKI